jgi:predicted permease
VRDPFILVAVTSILLGFTLNLTGVSRPALFSRVNSVVIPAGSFLLLASIGIAMEFRRIRKYLRPAMLVALTKFVFVPSVVVSAAALLGLGRFDDGLALKVVLILSSTPVAFLALVPPALYKLDLDLANSAWIVTTALLAVVVPLQMVVIRLLG